MALNILNTLICKEDIESRLKKLIKEYPEIVTVIPILIAVRGNVIKVADIIGDIEYSFIKKEKYSDEEIEKIVSFVNKSGFLKIIRDKNIKNLVDYTLGVEVGLDTNARKNRSGKVMENLIELYIKSTCDKYGFKYLSQATVEKIKKRIWKRSINR